MVKLFLSRWLDTFITCCDYHAISTLNCIFVQKYSKQNDIRDQIFDYLTVLRLWRHQQLSNWPDMFIIIFVPINKIKLLAHGREVSIEQQQVVQARVIWYVPCNSVKFNGFEHFSKLMLRGVVYFFYAYRCKALQAL